MGPLRRAAARAAAVLLVGAAGSLGLAYAPGGMVAPAAAATCSGSSGVTVVVDYRELGGGTVTGCAPDGGGKSATAIFAEVGVSLTYATRQPGFVCRVNGVPASDPCVNTSPANAYWGLWWADGSKSTWTYSSQGSGGTVIPNGGSVGWAWQKDRTSGNLAPPGVAAPVTRESGTPSPTPTPTSPPSTAPTPAPSPGPTPGPGPGASAPAPGTPGTPAPSPSPGQGTKPGTPGATQPPGSPAPPASPTRPPGADEAAPGPGDGDSPTPGDGLVPESPSDSPGQEGGLVPESPSDSPGQEGGLGLEPPSDSGLSPEAPGARADAAPPNEPTRVPAAVTWGVVALLAGAIATSAVMTHRRRTG
jgi:hypothetical protein